MENTICTNEIEILFEDADILVVNKPVGILSEDSQKGEKGIISLLQNEKRKNIHLLHRLDREVSGVMVFAKNKKSASILSTDIANGKFYKSYLAVTDGVPENDEGIYKDLLFKDSKKNRSFVVNRMRKGVREASLEYIILKKTESNALVRILLHTGRTHQIRVQFSSRKTPLTGDGRYGSKVRDCNIALHSHKIVFNHPRTKEQVEFVSNPDFDIYPWNLGSVDNA